MEKNVNKNFTVLYALVVFLFVITVINTPWLRSLPVFTSELRSEDGYVFEEGNWGNYADYKVSCHSWETYVNQNPWKTDWNLCEGRIELSFKDSITFTRVVKMTTEAYASWDEILNTFVEDGARQDDEDPILRVRIDYEGDEFKTGIYNLSHRSWTWVFQNCDIEFNVSASRDDFPPEFYDALDFCHPDNDYKITYNGEEFEGGEILEGYYEVPWR